MGWNDDETLNPEIRHKRLQREAVEAEELRLKLETDKRLAYSTKLESLSKRHTIRYLPYRTTCPKDIRYADLLNSVDSTVLLQLLQDLTVDADQIKRILQSRYSELLILAKVPKY